MEKSSDLKREVPPEFFTSLGCTYLLLLGGIGFFAAMAAPFFLLFVHAVAMTDPDDPGTALGALIVTVMIPLLLLLILAGLSFWYRKSGRRWVFLVLLSPLALSFLGLFIWPWTGLL